MHNIHMTRDARGVVTLTINRPEKRNAMDSAVMSGLASYLAELEADPSVRALVLRGAGGTFSAGRDLKEAGGLPLEQAFEQHGDWTSVFRVLHRLPFPSVAAVEGFAVAGGFTLAMGCDFVIAERSAQFGAMEMKNGFPAAVCTPILARLTGPRIGLELALFGDLIPAERLYALGLINQLAVGDEGLAEALTAFTDRIAALDPRAVRQTLETYRAAEQMPLDQSLIMGKQLNQLLDAAGSFRAAGARFTESDSAS